VRQITSTLVVAPHLGALVGLVGTLRELTARRCRVHVSVLEDPPPGIDVSAFASPIRRMTFGRLPALDHWSHLSATVRGVLDCWRWLDPEKRDERSFERALAEAPPLAARLARNRALRIDILRRPVTRLLCLIHDAIPAPAPVRHFLEAHRPGILMVAPMFGVGSIVPDYLRAANELGIPSVALPLCWDDLDARAWPHVIPDCLALWNREQRRQAVQTLGVPARRTAIVGGGLPLDVAGAISNTRQSFCDRHGLDPARAMVLLDVGQAGPGRATTVRECLERLRASADPCLRGATVIVHWPPPAGVQQREQHELTEVVIPRPDTDPAEYATELAEALAHADLLISDQMSLVLEAAARARPLVALVTDPDQELARFCRESGPRGWPRVADGLPALETAVASALRDGLDRAGQAAARTVVRPHGPDLSPGFLLHARLVASIADRRAAPRTVPSWVPWLRIVTAPLASWAARSAARLPALRSSRDTARILIAAPSASSLSLHQPVIRSLAERGHQLALVFTSRQQMDAQAYERIKCDVPNIVHGGVLPLPTGMWAEISQGLIGLSAYLAMLHWRKAGEVPQWLAELALTSLTAGTRPIARIARQSIGLQRWLRRAAASLDRAIPATSESQQLLTRHAPDVVLTLPDDDLSLALESAAAQADLVRAAASLGVPTASIATGPDAQIHASLLQPGPSMVLVWNEAQRDAVVRHGAVGRDAVLVSGALALERALTDTPLMTEQAFREAMGFPADRPFAFFCGSSGVLTNSRREMDLVRRWVASLRDSEDPLLRELPVLIRPPVLSSRWRSLDFTGAGPVAFGPRRYEASGELDRVLIAESVRYAAVVVGIDAYTLAMAAAMGKRGIAISRADAGSADETPIEFLWTTPGSSVSYAASLDDLNRQLRASLTPESGRSRSPFAATLTALHDGRRASDLAADGVERLARQTVRRARPRVRFGAVATRVPLLLAAGVVSATGRGLQWRRR